MRPHIIRASIAPPAGRAGRHAGPGEAGRHAEAHRGRHRDLPEEGQSRQV